MRSGRPPDRPRGKIVLRFALTGFLVFVLVGLTIVFFRTRDLRQREEQAAVSRAELVANDLIGPVLTPGLLERPMDGKRYARVAEVVDQVIASDRGIVRVKIWGPDGTVLFSNDREQVGFRPPMESNLEEAFDGEVEGEISNLDADENVSERALADKLFETYVPYKASPDAPVDAVIEVYRDYASIQAEIDRLTGTLTITLGVGLLILYVIMLPVMVGTTRTLRRQNEQLTELLEREQATVAELVELDRLQGDFVAAASHELRSPLTSILGYANLLRSSAPPDDPIAHEAVDAIERQSSRMLRLVMNLLRESRIEAEREDASFFPFDLDALVREVAADFHADGERVRSEIPADMPEVRCDSGKVADVLVNLIDNALKYAEPGTPVTVGAEVDGGTLTIRVSDQGPGIDPDDIPRIFDRFYQADQSATRAHGGVGLGLHIVRGLVESMGGQVHVDSVAGAGSTFTVRIPLVTEQTPAAAARLNA